MHDLVIRNGTLVDGSGEPPFVGDLSVDADRITHVGVVKGSGSQEIDARGHIVTPGFIDLHTHLDAQMWWDPYLTPATSHGVTTALMGNCGITFAPVRPEDTKVLAEMMEAVEDIPASAILSGLAWNWEDFGSFLDALGDLRPAANVAGLVGHCAIRRYVMGERGVDGDPTPDELQRIAEVVGDSISAGAFGFSTSRYRGIL